MLTLKTGVYPQPTQSRHSTQTDRVAGGDVSTVRPESDRVRDSDDDAEVWDLTSSTPQPVVAPRSHSAEWHDGADLLDSTDILQIGKYMALGKLAQHERAYKHIFAVGASRAPSLNCSL